MPRYVILWHELSETAEQSSHWDFMIQVGGESLHTWAIRQPPDECAVQHVVRLANHRPLYLDYEGPISGDRGQVRQWDCGVYSVLSSSPDHWQLHLQGGRMRGVVHLHLTDATPGGWIYSYERATDSRQ